MEFIGYFLIGGLVVSLTTYFGAKGQGPLAALVSMFPSMTVLIFCLLYKSGGRVSVIGYAKSLAYFVPPWVLYIATVAMLCERIGIWLSLAIGVSLYMVSSYCIVHLK